MCVNSMCLHIYIKTKLKSTKQSPSNIFDAGYFAEHYSTLYNNYHLETSILSRLTWQFINFTSTQRKMLSSGNYLELLKVIYAFQIIAGKALNILKLYDQLRAHIGRFIGVFIFQVINCLQQNDGHQKCFNAI